MTRQRRTNGDLRGFEIAHFADHDHIGVLPQDVPQPARKGQANFRFHVNLIYARQFVLDRVFDGDDALVDGIDRTQKRVQRCGLAGAGRTGDQNDAVRKIDEFSNDLFVVAIQPDAFESEVNTAARQQTQTHALAVRGRDCRDTHVDFFAATAHVNAAVLRQAPLGDVHVGHDLDARDDGRLKTFELWRHWRLVQHAVHSVTDAQIVLHRLQVNVGRPFAKRLTNDLVNELDDASFLVGAFEVFLGDLLLLGKVEHVFLHQFVERFGADAVIFLQRFRNVRLGAQRDLDTATRNQSDRLDHREIERVVGGNDERAVVGAHRHDVVLEDHFRGNL